MRKLGLRRHGDKDHNTLKNRIGDGGMDAARKLGDREYDNDTNLKLTHLFFHEEVRTVETALAFLSGYGTNGVKVHPAVPGMGNSTLFGEMITDPVRALVPEKGNFLAVLEVHGVEKVRAWCEGYFLPAVRRMFDAMDNNEWGISFSHSPTVEMIAFALADYNIKAMPDEFKSFASLEGVILQMDDDNITVVGKATLLLKKE